MFASLSQLGTQIISQHYMFASLSQLGTQIISQHYMFASLSQLGTQIISQHYMFASLSQLGTQIISQHYMFASLSQLGTQIISQHCLPVSHNWNIALGTKWPSLYLIQESPPQFQNQFMAWVYVRSITHSTMYQKAPFC